MNRIHLSAVDLNLLVVLDALLRTGSVSETAKRLGRTQSAVSHALGRLRLLFEDALLVRAGARMVPTSKARELAAPLAEAIGRVENLLSMPGRFEAAELERVFTIGAADFHELVLLAPLSRIVRREAPGVVIHTLNAGDDVEQRTRSGELAMSIAVSDRALAGLSTLPLFEERFRVVLRRGHPLARGKLTLRRYLAAEHAVIAPRGRPGSRVDDVLAARGLERCVVLRLGSFVAGPFVIAGTDLVLTLPSSVAAALAPRLGLVMRDPPLELARFSVALVYSRAFEDDPAHRWLRQCFIRAAKSAGRSRA
jgi:DNA-binding transcriptional LysR family regulator